MMKMQVGLTKPKTSFISVPESAAKIRKLGAVSVVDALGEIPKRFRGSLQ